MIISHSVLLSVRSTFRQMCRENENKYIMCEEREKPTRCKNQTFIINFRLNMFRASLCPSSGEQRPCYCIWCVVLVLLDVVFSGCGALSCRMRVAALRTHPWTHYLPTGLDNLPAATAHTNTMLYITQSSAPDDGHMVARNTLSNY